MSDKHQDKMTTERGFTAGEWSQDGVTPTRVIIKDRLGYGGRPYRIADAYFSTGGLANTPRLEEAQANARLIAQAPALVGALQECVAALENGLESDEGELEAPGSKSDRLTVARARTVLSRALGRGE